MKLVAKALLTVLLLGLPLSARPQQGPLTREQVVNLVKNQFGDKAGARAIQQRGIDFEPTPDFLDSLKSAGADDAFIQALLLAKRSSSQAKKPLSQVQVLALLAGQVPSHRVANLAADRGLDAEPTPQFLGEVTRAGGDQELLAALRAATVYKGSAVHPAAQAKEAEVRQHVTRGAEFSQKGQYAEAEQEYRAAAQLSPQSTDILVSLSTVLESEGKWDEGIRVSRQAVRLDPNNDNAHVNLGVGLGVQHDLDGAMAEFREALRLEPKNDGAHYNLGVGLMQKNDVDGAIAEYREALRLNPKNDAAHYGLGRRLELNKHDERGALNEYHTAYTLAPNNDTYKTTYERVAREVGQ